MRPVPTGPVPVVKQITIRIYGPLNDFLPPRERHACRAYPFEGPASVKDLIERLGVPHPEIDLILVNGTPVPFDYRPQDADRVGVFPRFYTLDLDGVTLVRPPPPAAGQAGLGPGAPEGTVARFVADGHLGKLARRLRLLGLDTAYRADAGDDELARIAAREGRILLTRDRELLKRNLITHGAFVRETLPRAQLLEVLRRFGPLPLAPFSRCLRCNGGLRPVPKADVEARLAPRTRRYYDEFRECPGCGRLYWKGSHWRRLAEMADAVLKDAGEPGPRA